MVSEIRTQEENLAGAVERALCADAATAGLVIQVEVVDGFVFLRGIVDELDDVPAAERVAAGVPGVAGVVEKLRVEHLL